MMSGLAIRDPVVRGPGPGARGACLAEARSAKAGLLYA